MKVVEEEAWSWTLLAEGEAHYLSVLCGTSAVYEFDVALTAEEIAQYRREGRAYAAKLASAVSDSPRAYQARHIADFHARPEVRAAIAAWRQSASAGKTPA